MGEVELVSFERAAGENPLAPGSRSPSPFPVEPGASSLDCGQQEITHAVKSCETFGTSEGSSGGHNPKHSAQPAASRPQEEARTNITAGSGGGQSAQSGGIIAPETSKWVSAPGRREHNALAFLRRRWGYYIITERGYWVRP